MNATEANILLVAPDRSTRQHILPQLALESLTVELVELDQCLARIRRDPPNLVLLDHASEPLELLRQLRASYSKDLLPVLIQVNDRDDAIPYLAAGANDFIVKPAYPPVLKARVEMCLSLTALASEVTARRRAEDELRLSEERFAKAFRSSPDGLTLSHRDSAVIFDCNDSFLKIFGYTREEVVGRSSLELGMIVNPNDRKRAIDELCANGTIRDFEAPGRRRNGEIFSVALQAEHIQIANQPCVLSIVRDDTERRRAREAMDKAKEQLELHVRQRTADLQRASDALRETEERFRIMAHNAPVLLWMTDTNGLCCFVNQSWTDFTGRTIQQEIGSGWAEGLHPDDHDRCLHAWRTAFDARASFDLDYRIRRLDGRFRWLFGKAVPRFLPDGSFAGYIGSCVDITERRQAEDLLRRANAALRESEQRFRLMADTAPVLLWMDGPDSASQFFNKSWLRFTGRTLEQELGFGWLEGIHPEDRDRCSGMYSGAREARQPIEIEYRLRRADGQYRWIYDCSVPRFLPDGSFAGYIGSCVDITDRREAEDLLRRANDALRESEQRFRTIADNAPVLLWMTAPDGPCTFTNKSWRTFTGTTEEQELGYGWLEGLHPDDRAIAMGAFRAALAQRRGFETEFRVRRIDGKYRWVATTGIPRFLSDGEFAGYIGSCMDITERREAEQLLRHARDELDRRVKERTAELAQSRDALLQEVNERRAANQQLLEYQQRLRGLASQVTLAEEEERRRIARGLHDQIGQSLALAKMRLGPLAELAQTDPEKTKDIEQIRAALDTAIQHTRSLTFDLGSRILYEFGLEPAIENLAEQMQQHYGIASSFQDDHQPKPLDEDVRVIMFQSVRELLHNVAKHARAQNVELSIARDGDVVRVDVADDGIGFDTRNLASRLAKTSGFGLFNIREQLDYVGGRVEFDSAPGQGARITLIAPVRAPAPEPLAALSIGEGL